jgi:hypothetical protein
LSQKVGLKTVKKCEKIGFNPLVNIIQIIKQGKIALKKGYGRSQISPGAWGPLPPSSGK